MVPADPGYWRTMDIMTKRVKARKGQGIERRQPL